MFVSVLYELRGEELLQRGPIDAIATYNFEARGYQFHDKSEHYGEVQTSKVVLLDEVYGAEGVVAARLAPSDPSQIAYHFPPAPDGTKLIIQVNAKEKKGYVLRMLMGGKTEIRFVIRYPEKKRPNQSAQTTPGSSAPLRV